MTPADCRRIADDLTDVYNYVSATTQKPSVINVLHANSARDAKLERQLTQEREALREHQQFVEDNFDKAEQYLRAIQLGGYGAFFGLWSITKDWLDPLWSSFAAILMIISGTTFVTWEISKGSILAFALRRHAAISAGKLEQFIKSRMIKLTQEKSARSILAESRATVWLLSVFPAVAAIGIMLWQLLGGISRGLFG